MKAWVISYPQQRLNTYLYERFLGGTHTCQVAVYFNTFYLAVQYILHTLRQWEIVSSQVELHVPDFKMFAVGFFFFFFKAPL